MTLPTTEAREAEAREMLGGPPIVDPGRFGVAIGYDKALSTVMEALRQRDEALEALKPFADVGQVVRDDQDYKAQIVNGRHYRRASEITGRG